MKKPNQRCTWAESPEILTLYHDTEWGNPEHNDQKLFEMLNLEGAQAGLSWLTVLKKRPAYRKAFDQFNAKKIARYTEEKKAELIQNEGIIRNRLKVNAVVENAKAFLAVQKEFKSFNHYIWSFTHGEILTFAKKQNAEKVSLQMSKDLKKRGFRFVGPTICYAFMQATGIVNDHSPTCFRRHSTP